MRFVTNISSFPKSFPLRPMYKEVVVSSSLKENTINVWDVNSCTNIFEFKENNGVRNGCVLVHCANHASDYGLFPQSIYSIQTPKPYINTWKYGKAAPLFRNAVAERMTSLCVSFDGAFLFGGGASGKLYIWYTSSGDLLRVVDAHYKAITVIRCVSDMSSLVTGGDDGLIRQWNISELIGGLDDVNKTIKPIWTVSEHSLSITDLAVRSGMYLLSSSGDKTVRVWDLFGHRLLSTIATPSVISSLVLTHTEHRCFAGAADGTIFIIDLTHPLEASVIAGGEGSNGVASMTAHTGMVTCLAMTGDDSKVVSGGEDGRIFVWDCASLQVLREYKGSNASAKMTSFGSAKEAEGEKKIVMLDVIPYPTLLFENENTVYPIKNLKKYKAADLTSFEPVLTLADMPEYEQENDDGFGGLPAIRFVGGMAMTGEQPVHLPAIPSAPSAPSAPATSSPANTTVSKETTSSGEKKEKEEEKEELEKMKALAAKWQDIAERLYLQAISSKP